MAEIEHVLTLAIGAAGQRDDPMEWRMRVLASCQDIAGMLNSHSLEWYATQRVLEPDGVFVVIYNGYRFEETSQRCVIQFVDPQTGEPETKKGQPVVIRTDRCDAPLGALMRQKLDSIPKGTKVRVWKALESFQDKSGDDAKFRVLAHIEPMSKRDDDRSQGSASPSREPERAAGTAVPDPSAGSSESYPDPAGDRPFGSLVEKRLAEMRGPERVNFIRHLAVEHKITDYKDPKLETEVLAAMEKFRGAA